MIQCDNPACAHDGAITIETRVGGHPAFVCLVCHRYYVHESATSHVSAARSPVFGDFQAWFEEFVHRRV